LPELNAGSTDHEANYSQLHRQEKMKADLHVHSKHSKRPSQWVLQKIDCPESFTEPFLIYQIARKRGMNLITLTDHNTIDGALEIAHLPDTFISEEITTYFPEDGCKMHVLALDITEAQHREIQRLRKNIYELTVYLHHEEILNIAAHPLYAVNDSLTLGHFEKMLLLFRNFELNGSRSDAQNRSIRMALDGLQAEDIAHLENKYDMKAFGERPWEKSLTGGSDDHSGLNIARTYTQVTQAGDATGIADFFAGIRSCRTQVISQPSTPLTMAHNLYAIAYQFYRNKLHLERHTHRELLLKYLDRSLRPDPDLGEGFLTKIYLFLNHHKRSRFAGGTPTTLIQLIRHETDILLREDARLADTSHSADDSLQEREQKWFDFVNRVTNKVLAHSANHLFGHLSGANVFNIFQTIGSAGGLYALLAPFFVSFAQFTKDKDVNDTIIKTYVSDNDPVRKNRPARVAHFTDTFYDVNGVAKTLQQQVEIAGKNNKDLTIITCDTDASSRMPGIQNFSPIGTYEFTEYPEQKLCYPPFLEILNYCYERGFTHIQSATPGPMGLAALAIAHILKIPVNGTYHTAFPQYARYLTGDAAIEDITWKYMIWYYNQMDHIYVSSESSYQELTERGIPAKKIRILPRGIDTELFHPKKRFASGKGKYFAEKEITLLYVGRISREKNLPLLVQAYRTLSAKDKNLRLLVVGDGPYLNEMVASLQGTKCNFTGYLKGEELSAAYAAADIFVFPSTTDTFGNVILEAQASGLPVIVSNQGGPCENMLPEKTGLITAGNNADSLAQAIATLAAAPERRAAMGIAARAFMEERSFANAFIRFWEMLEDTGEPTEYPSLQAAV
jgi:glycosyltransferase involved in cell wall biosynthesis/predicted metal-dependent phosphoesterase TrpH